MFVVSDSLKKVPYISFPTVHTFIYVLGEDKDIECQEDENGLEATVNNFENTD